MARVNRVQRSNKEHVCEVGGHTIPKGDPYLWAKPGFRTRRPKVRCVNHPFRESDLATGMRAEPLAAQEAFDDALSALEPHDYEGLNAAGEEFRSALEEYRDARQESLDAWENGNSALEDLLEQAEEALSEFEGSFEEAEEYDEEEPEEPQRSDFSSEDDYDEAVAEYEQAHEDWEAERDQHWQEAIDAASEASAAVSL